MTPSTHASTASKADIEAASTRWIRSVTAEDEIPSGGFRSFASPPLPRFPLHVPTTLFLFSPT